MAGKKAQFESALSSISDFIFKSAQAKKRGLKPPKPTGINVTNDIAGALAEIAANPAYYVGETALGLFDEAINKALIEFNVDKRYGDQDSGRIRVRPRELRSFLSDPLKIVDKAFEQAAAERAWSRNHLGGALDTGLAFLWAKKNGFDTSESLRIGLSAGEFNDYQMEVDAERWAGENAAILYLTSPRRNKVNEARRLSSELKKVGGRLTESRLRDILNHVGLNNTDRAVILGHYRNNADRLLRSYSQKEQVSGLPTTGWDAGLSVQNYRFLLSENLGYRARIASSAQEQQRLMKAKLAVDTWNRLKLNTDSIDVKAIRDDVGAAIEAMDARRAAGQWSGYDATIYKRFSRTKSELDKLAKNEDFGKFVRFTSYSGRYDYSLAVKAFSLEIDSQILKRQEALNAAMVALQSGTGNVTTLQNNITDLQREISDLSLQKKQIRSTSGRNFRYLIGNTTGTIKFIGAMGSGEFFSGVLSGKWFSQDVSGNAWAPGLLKEYKIMRNGHLAGKEKIILPKNDLNPMYSQLAAAYYFTPMSLAKTFLWNGEMFAFMSWQNQTQLMRALSNPNFVRDLRNSGLLTGRLAGLLKGNSFDKDIFRENFDTLMSRVATGNFGKFSTMAQKGLKRHDRFAKLFNSFSSVKRWWEGTGFYKRFTSLDKFFRQQFGNLLLKLSSNSTWAFQVGEFVAKNIGIQQLILKGVQLALSAAGIAGGPIGSVIAWVATTVAMKVAMTIAKPLVKFLILAVIGILFLIPMFGTIFGIFGTDSLTSAYRHVPPAYAAQCVDHNPHAGLYPEPPIENDGTGLPPSDSTCPLDYSPLVCNQGTHGNVSHYHQQTKAIDVRTRVATPDITAWHAPSDGRIVSYKPSNTCADGKDYGGTLVFQDTAGNVYKMLHIRALKSSGNVTKGQAIAVVRTDLQQSDCWTGEHHHLEVISSGGYQDAYDWYVGKLQCDIGTCPQ